MVPRDRLARPLAIELLWDSADKSHPQVGPMDKHTRENLVALTLARLESRIARIETQLGLGGGREAVGEEGVRGAASGPVVTGGDRQWIDAVAEVGPTQEVPSAKVPPPPLPPMPGPAPVVPAYE